MIESKLVELLKENKYHISFAESMTGGMLASTIINVSGASDVIEKSFITYSIIFYNVESHCGSFPFKKEHCLHKTGS